MTHRRVFFCIIIAIIFSVLATAAEAREWRRQGHYATDKGHKGTISAQGDGGEGAWSRQTTIKTDKGKTVTRTIEGSYDPETRTVNRTVHGWNGKTHTTTSTYDPKTGAFTAKATGAKGKSVAVTGTAGQGEREGAYETSGGAKGTFQSELTRNSDGSYTRNGSVTTGSGETYTNSNTVSYDRDTRTLTDTYTGYNGATHSGTVTVDTDSLNQ